MWRRQPCSEDNIRDNETKPERSLNSFRLLHVRITNKRIIKIVCFVLLFHHGFSVSAQTRNEFWGKLSVTHQVSAHWSIGVDLQHKRQANYQTNDKNIFRYQLGNYIRLSAYYKLPGKWTIVLFPIGYYDNEDILSAEGKLKLTNELRISPGIIKSFDIGRVNNRNRFIYDIRFAEFDKPTHFMQSRFHLQNSLTIPFHSFTEKKSLNYYFFNEIFVKKHKSDIGFDQNRVYNALQWKFNHSDITMGYQWAIQKGTNGIFHHNQLYVSLNLVI